MDKVLEKFVVHADNVTQIAGWLKAGRGLAHWTSIDLSDLSFALTTPALTDGEPTKQPHWKVGNKPERVIFDASEVEVRTYVRVKEFRVGVRMGGTGLRIKCTDGATRRIHRELAKAGDGAVYRFNYEDQTASILKPDGSKPLTKWMETQ